MSYFSASSSLATGFVNVLSIFFCKQKTAYELRISDWNSDVCSSDLIAARRAALGRAHRQHRRRWGGRGLPGKAIAASVVFVALLAGVLFWQHGQTDRNSVVWGKGGSDRLALVGRLNTKKNKA